MSLIERAMKIKVTGIPELKKALRNISRNEVPYVTQIALNDVTKEAQADIRKHIDEEFIVRRKSYVNKAIKIVKWAKKTDLKAILAVEPPGGAQDVLSRHEFGGVQTPENSKHFAIPTQGIWKNKRRVLSKRLRPANINAWKATDSTSGTLMLLRQRTKKIVQVAYILKDKIRLRKRLSFVETAQRTVNTRYEDIWGKKWNQIMKKRFGFK